MNLIFFRIKKTTNVVLKTIPFITALFILANIKFLCPAYAQQGISNYPEDQSRTTPAITAQQAETKTAVAPQASLAIPAIPPSMQAVVPLSKVEVTQVGEGEQTQTIALADRSQFFYDAKTHEGRATDDTGLSWDYTNVSFVRDGALHQVPDEFVEISKVVPAVKTPSAKEGTPSLRVVYGKPKGEIRVVALNDEKLFVNDAETRTGTLLANDSKLEQYSDVHEVVELEGACMQNECTKSLKDFVVPEGYREIGKVTEVEFILPNGTTVVAKKLLYGKFDKDFLISSTIEKSF